MTVQLNTLGASIATAIDGADEADADKIALAIAYDVNAGELLRINPGGTALEGVALDETDGPTAVASASNVLTLDWNSIATRWAVVTTSENITTVAISNLATGPVYLVTILWGGSHTVTDGSAGVPSDGGTEDSLTVLRLGSLGTFPTTSGGVLSFTLQSDGTNMYIRPAGLRAGS